MTAPMAGSATMVALATACLPVTDRAYPFPKEDPQPPCIVIGYPSEWDYDVTFGVGNARAVYPLWYVVGKVTEEATRDKVFAAEAALKTALEAASLVIHVRSAAFEPVIVGTVPYMSVRLDCEVVS